MSELRVGSTRPKSSRENERSLKRPYPDDAESNSTGDEITTAPTYNVSISVDELDDMEKEMNEFMNEDDDDDDDDDEEEGEEAKTSQKKPRTAEPNEVQDDASNSSAKLREMKLNEEELNINDDELAPSDEESLTDDETPLGWKAKPKVKKFICEDIEH